MFRCLVIGQSHMRYIQPLVAISACVFAFDGLLRCPDFEDRNSAICERLTLFARGKHKQCKTLASECRGISILHPKIEGNSLLAFTTSASDRCCTADMFKTTCMIVTHMACFVLPMIVKHIVFSCANSLKACWNPKVEATDIVFTFHSGANCWCLES